MSSRSAPKWVEVISQSAQVIKPSTRNDHIIIGSRQSVKTVCINDDNVGLQTIRSIKSTTASTAIAFHPIADSVIASAASNGEVSTLYYGAQNIAPLNDKWVAHSRAIHAMEFLPSPPDRDYVYLLTVSADGDINIWSISAYIGRRETWKRPSLICNARADGHRCGLRDLDVRNTKSNIGYEMLVACDDGSIEHYTCGHDPVNFSLVWKLSISTQTINSIRFSTTDRHLFATGGKDSYIRIYSLSEGVRCLCSIRTPSSVWAIRWRPSTGSGHIAACQSIMDSAIYIWDLTNRLMPAYVFNSHRDNVTDFFWADVNHIMSCSRDSTIQIHELKNAIIPIEKMRTVNISFSARNGATTSQTITSVCDIVNREKFERDHGFLDLDRAKRFGFPVTNVPSGSISNLSLSAGVVTPLTGLFSRTVCIRQVPYKTGFTLNPSMVVAAGGPLIKFIAKISANSDISSTCMQFANDLEIISENSLKTHAETIRLLSWFITQRPEMISQVARLSLNVYKELNDIVMVLAIGAMCMFSTVPDLVSLVDTQNFFKWSSSILEIFSRLGQWKLAAEFIYMSPVSEVRSLSHSRTTINLACRTCKRERDIGTDICKCRARLAACVLCGDAVKGLWVSCPGCMHGGHVKHMDWWFENYSVCPVPGCLHDCR
jgi:WD40 repeat protein